MESFLSRSIEKYIEAHTSPESQLLEELEKETYEKMDDPEMLIGKAEGRLLQMLVQVSGSRRVLEIGTFTGYSALMMAEGLPEDGELTTCEIEQKHAEMAQRYFDKSPHGKKIQIKIGPALDTLSMIPAESIHFVFIDADKPSYPDYYRESLRILKKGGIIVADNALWNGRVLNPQDDDSIAIDTFNKIVRKDARVENTILTVRDGVHLIRKKI